MGDRTHDGRPDDDGAGRARINTSHPGGHPCALLRKSIDAQREIIRSNHTEIAADRHGDERRWPEFSNLSDRPRYSPRNA